MNDEAFCDSWHVFLHSYILALGRFLYYVSRVMTKHNLRKNATETYRIRNVQHIIPTNADDHETV